MTQAEIDSLNNILAIFCFEENNDANIEHKFAYVEQKLGYSLAQSYKICMKKYKNVECAYRHLLPVEEILEFLEIEKQENIVPQGFYILEYLDDITVLQDSKGEIFIFSNTKLVPYAPNLEIYLKEKWNENIIEKIKDNLEFSCKNTFNIKEIKEAENILELSFAPIFRACLNSFSLIKKGERKILSLFEVVEETLKARQNNAHFPKNIYIIEYIKEKKMLIAQDKNGILYEINASYTIMQKAISLASYIEEME